jgi:uncharacterized membrane protein (DUF4010 family)
VGDAELQIPLREFAIALFLGALVGIEREKKQAEETQRGIGGLRTFILFALAGAVAGWLSRQLGSPWIFLATGGLVTATVIAGYVSYTRAQRGSYGLTTEVAAIVVYLLGGTALLGFPELAVALAIATSAVLAFKEPMHGLVDRMGRDDIYAGLKLLIATFIVLPVLPDRPIDPWGAINPYRMWWLVILISGLSLVGYVATRWAGRGRGAALTGLFGGLVSSTAVTLSFARRSHEESAHGARAAGALAAGILIAWATMFARVIVLASALDAALLRALLLPMGALGALCMAAAFAVWRQGSAPKAGPAEEVPLRNPFSLTAAIQFAALFGVVMLLVKLAAARFPGQGGLYAVAALAGLTDVDAITLSMAESAASDAVAGPVAANAIVVAAASNTLVKSGVVAALGTPALRRRVGLASAALLAAAAALVVLR